MKTKINQALDNTVRELDEVYLNGNMTPFLTDLDKLVLSTMLSSSGLSSLKNLVSTHQELILDYSIQLLVNLSIEGITIDAIKSLVKNSLLAHKSQHLLSESARKILNTSDNITDDNIILVLFLTKLNIKRIINLVNVCKPNNNK